MAETNTLQNLEAQIAALKKGAVERFRDDVTDRVKDLRALAETYGLRPAAAYEALAPLFRTKTFLTLEEVADLKAKAAQASSPPAPVPE